MTLVAHIVNHTTIAGNPWVRSLVLRFTISAAVGVVFGLYPSIRAANMEPAKAL